MKEQPRLNALRARYTILLDRDGNVVDAGGRLRGVKLEKAVAQLFVDKGEK